MVAAVALVVNSSEITTEISEKPSEKAYKWDMVWPTTIILLLLHIGAIYGFYLRLTSPHHSFLGGLFARIVGLAGSIGITAGAHRYWTHRSYDASLPVQILLMIMTTLTYQNSIYTWARDHRLHHKHSETDADPHNAKRGFFFSHVGWLMIRKHPQVREKGKSLDMSDLESDPVVMFQHRHYYKLVLLLAVVIPIIVERYIIGAPWMETIFIYTIYRYVFSVNTTWCVNSLAHLHGFRPYDKSIGPAENPLMKVIGMGEGFHNYHHVYPYDYKASEFSNDTRNLTTFVIDTFAHFGWVWNRKTVATETINKRVCRTGDGQVREYYKQHEGVKKAFWNCIHFILACSYVFFA